MHGAETTESPFQHIGGCLGDGEVVRREDTLTAITAPFLVLGSTSAYHGQHLRSEATLLFDEVQKGIRIDCKFCGGTPSVTLTKQ